MTKQKRQLQKMGLRLVTKKKGTRLSPEAIAGRKGSRKDAKVV